MSKKEVVVSLLSSTARSAIAKAFNDALSANEGTGAFITQVCNVAQSYLKGDAMPEGDRADIVASIAKQRGWKPASIKIRASECNTVLKAYAQLPEAIKLLRAKVGKAQWHDAMRMARVINKGKSVSQAVAFCAAKKKGAEKGNAIGRLAGALSSAFDAVKGAKRDAVVSAMRELTNAGVLKLTGKTAEKFANA